MIITPIDVGLVTDAVEAMLSEDAELKAINTRVENGEKINDDPSQMPWAGIYRTGVAYPSRTLGHGPGYRRQQIGLAIILQQTHIDSGKECGKLLEKLIQHVLRILLSDESMRGQVDTFDEVRVDYSQYGIKDSVYTQSAIITIVGLVNVSGG